MAQAPIPNYFTQEEETLDIKEIVGSYLRYWPWIVGSVLLFLTGSYFYLRYAPKVYETTAKVKILDKDKAINLPAAENIFNRSNVNLENEIEILTSYRILERVVNELGLTSVYHEEGRIQTSQMDQLPFEYRQTQTKDSLIAGSHFKVSVVVDGFEIEDSDKGSLVIFKGYDTSLQSHNLPFELRLAPENNLEPLVGKHYLVDIISTKEAVLGLKRALSVQPVGTDSEVLQLRLEGESASRSERILNALINAFNQDGIEDRQLISRRTIDFIDDRFVFLAQELDSIEVDKKDFKQDNNLVYLDADSQVSLERRTQADEELFQLENQLALSRLLEEALSSNGEDSELLPANIGLNNGALNNLIEDYNKAVLDKEKLVASGGVNNPLVQQLNATLSELGRNINRSIQAYKQQLELSKEQYSGRNARFRSEVYRIPEKEKLLRAIERQQAIKESLYLLLLQKREEAAISLAVTEPSVKVVEYALSGTRPISPKTKQIYLFGLLLGLLVPIGILYLMFLFDTKIHGEKDFENLPSELSVSGVIPEIKKGKNNVFSNPNDRSVLAEAFRILASNVKYMLPPKGTQGGSVIYCTSTAKGEGKTFVSVNLSLALSSLNKKVLLVGADLRNPQLHAYLNVDRKRNGLTNYLYDTTADWKAFTIKGFENHPTHEALVSGEIPPNPPHLLSNGRFEQFLEEAKQEYDYIVVDTAPTLLVTDTLLISEFADATLYLTKANYTEKRMLEYAADLVKQKKLHNLAFVINSVGNSRKGRYQYNYGYQYGYSEE